LARKAVRASLIIAHGIGEGKGKAGMKPETKFRTNQVLPFLHKLKKSHPKAIKWTPISQRSNVGDPDYILNILGLYVELELKALKGVKRKLQIFKAEETRATGGRHFFADPSNWKTIKAQLIALVQGGHHDQNTVRETQE
jgi:hypothetical protein